MIGNEVVVVAACRTAQGTFGGERNTVHLITGEGTEEWPTLAKDAVAMRLAGRIALQLGRPRSVKAAE